MSKQIELCPLLFKYLCYPGTITAWFFDQEEMNVWRKQRIPLQLTEGHRVVKVASDHIWVDAAPGHAAARQPDITSLTVSTYFPVTPETGFPCFDGSFRNRQASVIASEARQPQGAIQ